METRLLPLARYTHTHLHDKGPAGPATWSIPFTESISSLALDLYTLSAGSPSSGPGCVNVTWKETRESRLNRSQPEGPQCCQSCSCLLSVMWVKFVCWTAQGTKYKKKCCIGVFLLIKSEQLIEQLNSQSLIEVGRNVTANGWADHNSYVAITFQHLFSCSCRWFIGLVCSVYCGEERRLKWKPEFFSPSIHCNGTAVCGKNKKCFLFYTV